MRVYQAPTWNENEAVFFAFVVVDAVIRDVVTAVLWSSVSESSGGGGRRRCERIKADRALTVFTDEHSKIMAEYVSQPTQQQMLIVLLFCLSSLLTNYLEQRSRTYAANPTTADPQTHGDTCNYPTFQFVTAASPTGPIVFQFLIPCFQLLESLHHSFLGREQQLGTIAERCKRWRHIYGQEYLLFEPTSCES